MSTEVLIGRDVRVRVLDGSEVEQVTGLVCAGLRAVLHAEASDRA